MYHFCLSVLIALALTLESASAQALKPYQEPNVLNPLLPGYFADPTIKKIGDTYYIYATTDGNGWGAGPSQVWISKDFRNWTIQPMNWPNTHWYWAPDMTQGYDGRYYLYYSQPVEIFGAVSDSPIGPWEPLVDEGKSMIPNYMIPGVITLDGQTFRDDDGRMYMYWGTWGIYPGHGCAVGLLNRDMKSFEKIELIPNTVAKDFFEAPYMFKRNGIYYLMYSSGHCEDDTYRVQYVSSKTGPMGPFEYPLLNPTLVTNEDGSIHGPGHHSILQEDDRYFIVYHRHNNPHSGGGFHRQVAIDELHFTPDGDIQKVKPTHQGVSDLLKFPIAIEDLAFGKMVKASSYYNEDFRPSFLVDNNNGTLWRAKNNQEPAWVEIDLGKLEEVQTVLIQFEYPTYAYQYRLETSADGQFWSEFVDRSTNNRWASPIIEHGSSSARYVRLQVLNTQMNGLPRGIWNLKVYSKRLAQETLWSEPQPMLEREAALGNLLQIDATDYCEGHRIKYIKNNGLLTGELIADQPLVIKNYQGKRAFFFNGSTALRSTFAVPQSLSSNSAFTVAMWVNNPSINRFEQLVAWSQGNQDLTKAVFGFGSDPQRGAITHGSWPDMGFSTVPSQNEWHHVVLSFDGYQESIYIDGKLQRRENRMLFINPGDAFIIGASDVLDHNFSGYVASINIYNYNLDEETIVKAISEVRKEDFFALQTDDLNLGKVSNLRNQGTSVDTLVTIEDAEALVQGNRIALKGKNIDSENFAEMLQKTAYSLVFDWYDGVHWQHGLFIADGAKKIFYQNGKIARKAIFEKLFSFRNKKVTFTYPFHFVRSYPYALTANQAIEKFTLWNDKLTGDLDRYTPKILSYPRYINANSLFVQVEKQHEGLWYLFRSDYGNSGWIQQAYHLFNHSELGKSIEILAKDEFGHVSQVIRVDVSKNKPELLSSAHTENYKFKANKIPFWDGYQTNIWVDSTQTAITSFGETWKLQSRHTKWGEVNFRPPFVYKELIGDFTIEVQVKDVVGQRSKIRTSNEAGIMIQSIDSVEAYINNCILTGWNLGNLSRSIGEGIFQEGNTGKGLDFSPYLQVQKVGDYFFLRCSQDGINWKNLPNTPFLRKDLHGKTLRVGLYQLAGNNQLGYGDFEKVKIWK